MLLWLQTIRTRHVAGPCMNTISSLDKQTDGQDRRRRRAAGDEEITEIKFGVSIQVGDDGSVNG